MIQRYEVESWNEWDGASLKPAVDGDLVLFTEAEEWVQEEVEKWAGDRKEWMDKAMALARKNCELQKEIAALKEKIKEQDEAIYCPTCGACGEEGCCPPDRCEHLKCFYGGHYAKTYRELEAENETLRTLVDGVTEIVETWAAENPSQKVWKADWLAKAREILK